MSAVIAELEAKLDTLQKAMNAKSREHEMSGMQDLMNARDAVVERRDFRVVYCALLNNRSVVQNQLSHRAQQLLQPPPPPPPLLPSPFHVPNLDAEFSDQPKIRRSR